MKHVLVANPPRTKRGKSRRRKPRANPASKPRAKAAATAPQVASKTPRKRKAAGVTSGRWPELNRRAKQRSRSSRPSVTTGKRLGDGKRLAQDVSYVLGSPDGHASRVTITRLNKSMATKSKKSPAKAAKPKAPKRKTNAIVLSRKGQSVTIRRNPFRRHRRRRNPALSLSAPLRSAQGIMTARTATVAGGALLASLSTNMVLKSQFGASLPGNTSDAGLAAILYRILIPALIAIPARSVSPDLSTGVGIGGMILAINATLRTFNQPGLVQPFNGYDEYLSDYMNDADGYVDGYDDWADYDDGDDGDVGWADYDDYDAYLDEGDDGDVGWADYDDGDDGDVGWADYDDYEAYLDEGDDGDEDPRFAGFDASPYGPQYRTPANAFT